MEMENPQIQTSSSRPSEPTSTNIESKEPRSSRERSRSRHHHTRSRSPRRRSYSSERRSRSSRSHRYHRDHESRRSRSPRSPRRHSRSPRRYSRSPRRYSRSPRRDSERYIYDEDHLSIRAPPMVDSAPTRSETVEDELTRNDRTLFISDMLPKVTEDRIRKYFIHCHVKDVRLIRDHKTKRSKGMGYLELATVEDAAKALMLNGQKLCTKHDTCNCSGFPIKVQRSEGDRNITQAVVRPPRTTPSTKIIINNLPKQFTESDIQSIFSEFGPIENVTIAVDDENKSKGIAYVTYRRNDSARLAVRNMNNTQVAHYTLNVSILSSNASTSSFRLEDNEDNGVVLSNQTRAEIMRTLAQTKDKDFIQQRIVAGGPSNDVPLDANGNPIITGNVSHCIVLKNVYNSIEETDPDWQKDICDDIASECQKYGQVLHISLDASLDGNVYIMFNNVQAGRTAANALNGRPFNRRKLAVAYIPAGEYVHRFPDTRQKASQVSMSMNVY